MKPELLDALLLTQAASLVPKNLQPHIRLMEITATADGPKSVQTDRAGKSRAYNFRAVYGADGRAPVPVVLSLADAGGLWQVFPDRPWAEIEEQANAAPQAEMNMLSVTEAEAAAR